MVKILLTSTQATLFSLPNLEYDEFIPLLKLEKTGVTQEQLAAFIESGKTVTLSAKIDSSKRTTKLVEIIASPGKTTLSLDISEGKSTYDGDGLIRPRLSANAKNTTVSPAKDTYSEIGEKFQLSIDIVDNHDQSFEIDFLANDDHSDLDTGEYKNLLCGKIAISVFQDVFSSQEIKRLTDEIDFLKKFADNHSPSEYAGNYCMSAAERGISALLNDTTHFYSVDKSHKRRNKVGFANKGAKDRGADFERLGLTKSTFTFTVYNVDHNLRIATKDETDLQKNMYRVVTLANGSALKTHLDNDIKDRRGKHAYYFSVSDDFHTLLLIIDNSDASSETYAMYDQHGKTSSSGSYGQIESGFARQTSWTFLNDYMNRGFIASQYGRVTTRLWKIQRKV